mmetsp:Transcript_41513/g.53541  ORF Transcript_41513/g.53541 Transcript_41513/m.53541 type:complete len:748 (-) Transcript_41513:115-2358(-)
MASSLFLQNQSVVGFIDLDCFYVAVEENGPLGEHIRGFPAAVVQYNSSVIVSDCDSTNIQRLGCKIGNIIAVNYAARAKGVTRFMIAQEALDICPNIKLIRVPTKYGKSELSLYKKAGNEVVDILKKRASACEKRSVDEVAIDITREADKILHERSWENILATAKVSSFLANDEKSMHAAKVSKMDIRLGHAEQQTSSPLSSSNSSSQPQHKVFSPPGSGWNKVHSFIEQRLIAGAVVISELRAQVTRELGYTCSGGVAVNKLLSKLGCGLHKPNQQTIVLPEATSSLLDGLVIERLGGLGGAFGTLVKDRILEYYNSNNSQSLTDVLKSGETSDSTTTVPTQTKVTCGMVLKVPMDTLDSFFGQEKAKYLYRMCSGIQNEKVQNRSDAKSFNSVKSFKHQILKSFFDVDHWLGKLSSELYDRMDDHRSHYRQVPTLLTLGVDITIGTCAMTHTSKSCRLDIGVQGGCRSKIAQIAQACFRKIISNTDKDDYFGVSDVSLSMSSFVSLESNSGGMAKWIATSTTTPSTLSSSSSSSSILDSKKPLNELKKTVQSIKEVQPLSIKNKDNKDNNNDNDNCRSLSTEASSVESNQFQVDKECLSEITQVGIQEDIARSSLEKSNNNVSLAFDYIFSSQQTGKRGLNATISNPKHDNNLVLPTKLHETAISHQISNKSFFSKNSHHNITSGSKYVGIEAHDVDESVFASLPGPMVCEIRRQMLLEATSKKKNSRKKMTEQQSKCKKMFFGH